MGLVGSGCIHTHRARVRRCRRALGHGRLDRRFARVVDRVWRGAARRAHRIPNREVRPRAALLDRRAQHSRALWRVRAILLHSSFFLFPFLGGWHCRVTNDGDGDGDNVDWKMENAWLIVLPFFSFLR